MDYAIVDTAARSDAMQALRYYAEGYPAHSLFARQPEATHADAGPWLVGLDGNAGMRNWLHALDLHLGAVSRLSSDENFEAVFYHLESRLDMRLADGSLALFRFWDGRALYRVWRVMTLEQKKAFMGPVSRWSARLPGQVWELDRSKLEAA